MSDTYFLDLLISLVVTVAIYSLPIIIVRYAILRRPIARTTAMWVTMPKSRKKPPMLGWSGFASHTKNKGGTLWEIRIQIV